jgi:hypothetical protein
VSLREALNSNGSKGENQMSLKHHFFNLNIRLFFDDTYSFPPSLIFSAMKKFS